MMLTEAQRTGGLTPEHDYFFAGKPENPEMRESISLWLYEENGEFGFPRFGIEAEAHSWDNRLVQGNFAIAGGRIFNGAGLGAAHSPIGPGGKAEILGAGPLAFRVVEPFKKWVTTWDGDVTDGTVEQQIHKTLDPARKIPVRFEIELEIVGPGWVQDHTPEAVAKMSKEDAIEAGNMGIGWRVEQLVKGTGQFTYDGRTHDFKTSGIRVKRQSVRPMAGFRGHCWQSALFPDGSGFAYIAYPPREDGYAYNDGYIFKDGKMYEAKAVEIPFLRKIMGEGDDVSLVLESELGQTRISGSTTLSTFQVGNAMLLGLDLQQGGARYTWGDQTAYGMIERSSHHCVIV